MTKLWDDSGTGGRSGAIYRCGSLGLVQIVVGAGEPAGVLDLAYGFRLEMTSGQIREMVGEDDPTSPSTIRRKSRGDTEI